MSEPEVKISLSGLTALEVAELRAALVKAGADPTTALQVSPERGDVVGTKKGEPATILALLVVGQLAITGLALYLAKGRSRTRKKETLVVVRPNGERIDYTLDIAIDKEVEIKADLMKAVGDLKVPTPASGP